MTAQTLLLILVNTVSVWQTIKSVLSAFFGVSSGERRQRDFADGNPIIFLLVGLGMTMVFMLNIFLFVYYIV